MALDGVATNLQVVELGVGQRPSASFLAVMTQQLLGDFLRAAAETPLLLEDEPLHALDLGNTLRLTVIQQKFVLGLQVGGDVVVPVVDAAARSWARKNRDACRRLLLTVCFF